MPSCGEKLNYTTRMPGAARREHSLNSSTALLCCKEDYASLDSVFFVDGTNGTVPGEHLVGTQGSKAGGAATVSISEDKTLHCHWQITQTGAPTDIAAVCRPTTRTAEEHCRRKTIIDGPMTVTSTIPCCNLHSREPGVFDLRMEGTWQDAGGLGY